ncbi:MAG: TonB-dependent receptor [Deltaproteobacteria bacterium]|nr:TonB-dependent receptor [Deltaproteobacteria bacterium]
MKYAGTTVRVAILLSLGLMTMPMALWAQDTAEDFGDVGSLGDLDLDALLSLDLTVTSATKFEQTVSEAPAIISVITAKQIEERGYQSVAEALQSVPGLYVNTDWVSPDVGVRGVSGGLRGGSRVIKVMINSQPVSFRIETTNWLGPEFIPLKAIERIEVIRGPGSALYGANAFLGVVNVITRSGESANGGEFWAQGSQALGRNSYTLGVQGGRQVGAAEYYVAIQRNETNRSGLSIPITYQDEQWQEQNENLLGRTSYDDFATPWSLVATMKLDVGSLLLDEDEKYGFLSAMVNHQSLTSGGSFTDWSVLQYDEDSFTLADGERGSRKVRNTGNRVGLHNTTTRLNYMLNLFDAVDVTLGAVFAQGGTSSNERLRQLGQDTEIFGQVPTQNRGHYGYTSMDVMGEVYFTVLENALTPDSGFLEDVTVINNLSLVLAADLMQDTISYQERPRDREYLESDLSNVGVLGQLTGSLFNKRLGFIVGARYDEYSGPDLSEYQLDAYEDKVQKGFVGEKYLELCEGNSVCYSSLNYRAGLTMSLLQKVGKLGDYTLLDNLYLKALYGTAFKAPAPSYLYNNGTPAGQTPIQAFAGLLPQDVNSLEFLLGADFLDGHVNLSLVYFMNDVVNKTGYKKTGSFIIAYNALDVKTMGVEATLNVRWEPVELSVGFSQQSSERLPPEGSEFLFSETVAFPELMMNANLTVDVAFVKSYLNIEYQYIGERTGFPFNQPGVNEMNTERYTLGAYNLMNVSLTSYALNIFGDDMPTTFNCTVRNLLAEEYQYPGFQMSYGIDLPGEPRRVFLGVKQKF